MFKVIHSYYKKCGKYGKACIGGAWLWWLCTALPVIISHGAEILL